MTTTLQVINEYDEDGRQTPDFLRIKSQMLLVSGADDPTPWFNIPPSRRGQILIAVHSHRRLGLRLYVLREYNDWNLYKDAQPPERWAYFSVHSVFVPKPEPLPQP